MQKARVSRRGVECKKPASLDAGYAPDFRRVFDLLGEFSTGNNNRQELSDWILNLPARLRQGRKNEPNLHNLNP